jgi:hypothetical protein
VDIDPLGKLTVSKTVEASEQFGLNDLVSVRDQAEAMSTISHFGQGRASMERLIRPFA